MHMNIIDEMIMVVKMRISDLQNQLSRLEAVREDLNRMPDLLMIAGETAGKFERLLNQIEIEEPEEEEEEEEDAPIDFGRYEYDRDGKRKRLAAKETEIFIESTANGVNHYYEGLELDSSHIWKQIERMQENNRIPCPRCGNMVPVLQICMKCYYGSMFK